MAAGPYEGQTPERDRSVEHAERVTGWWYFAGILLTIAGVLNIIWGIVAISESRFITTTGAVYVFGHIHTWGWITLILGALEILAGAVAVRRRRLRALVRDHHRRASSQSSR